MTTTDTNKTARTLVVIVNGYPQSGKDTFVMACRKAFMASAWMTRAYSKTDIPLRMLHAAEIDVSNKRPHDRKLLADIINALDAYEDHIITDIYDNLVVCQAIAGRTNNVAFVHIRDPKSIEGLRTRAHGANMEVVTVFIDRPSPERVWSNDADSNVENFAYDVVVKNGGTIENLEQNCLALVAHFIRESGN